MDYHFLHVWLEYYVQFVSDTDVMAKSDLQISDYADPDKRGRDNRNRRAQHFFRHFR